MLKKIIMETYQKDIEFGLKGPLDKCMTISASKYKIIVMDCNSLNKIKILKSILIKIGGKKLFLFFFFLVFFY